MSETNINEPLVTPVHLGGSVAVYVEPFAEYFARKHSMSVGQWAYPGERHDVILGRFMDTMAAYITKQAIDMALSRVRA